jgi:tetratricopeptide (TPR) repeat protein
MMSVKDRRLEGIAFLAFGAFCVVLYSWTYEYVLVWGRDSDQSFFLFTRQFLTDFLPIPGGLIHYAGRFFEQFYEYTALGALVVALLLTGLAVLLHGVLKRLMDRAALFCALLPCILLATTLGSNIINMTVGLIASVGPFLIYLHLPKGGTRRIYALVAMPALYLLSGGYFWLFAFWVAATEWLENKPSANVTWKLLWPALAVGVPVIAWRWLFLVPLRGAFLRPTIFVQAPPLQAMLVLGYLALLPFCAKASRRWRAASAEGAQRGLVAGAALLALTAVVPIWLCCEPTGSELTAYLRLYRQKRWDDILSRAAGNPSTALMQQFFTNCALSHKGRLLDEMFHYPQPHGPRGLIMNFPGVRRGVQDDTERAMYDSDLFFEMGHVDEALTLAFDHMMRCGMTYENVSRMAECSLANGADETARKYVALLGRTLFHRGFARRCERLLADAKARDEYFAQVRARMPTVDLPIPDAGSFVPLLALVESHSDNRMAFDYLIAWCLLEPQAFPMLPDYLSHLKEAGYTVLPTHVQEALLTLEERSGRAVEIPGFRYDPKTKARFHEFLGAIGIPPYGPVERPELWASFDDTFMYYDASKRKRSAYNYGQIFWYLGNELGALGMDEEALAHYRCAVWLIPRVALTHLKLADLLKKQGKLDEAEFEYGEARKLGRPPAQPSGKLNQGAPPERVE